MGIKNLHKFLRKHIPELYRIVPLTTFSGKRVALDTSLFLYKYKSTHKENWLTGFSNLISTLLKHNIYCVFVYDSKAPAEKNLKKEERKQRKMNAKSKIDELENALKEAEETGFVSDILKEITYRKYEEMEMHLEIPDDNFYDKNVIQNEISFLHNQIVNVTRKDISISKEYLDLLHIPYIVSRNEAEAEKLCSELCIHGYVDYVLSDDTDVLAYGSPNVMMRINITREECTLIQYDTILQKLNLKPSEFVDFCILCGTDYNSNIKQIGNEKAYTIILNHRTIENAKKYFINIDFNVLNFQRGRELFKVEYHPDEYVIHWDRTNINQEALLNFITLHSIKVRNIESLT